MKLADLSDHISQWFDGSGPSADIVISSRVRLARNVAGFNFLSCLTEDRQSEVLEILKEAVLGLKMDEKMFFVAIDAAEPLEKELLVERRLISRQHAAGAGARGAVVASGSDFPVELPNPFLGLYAAVTRQDRNGNPGNGWFSGQAMSRAEALHSFTLAAAFSAHQEDRLGSLESGKWADFIVVDRNYFEIPESEIDDIKVLQTWVGGKLAYDSETVE